MSRRGREIRVGIVGASANRSWAKVSHVPAIKGLAGLKLAAVATGNGNAQRAERPGGGSSLRRRSLVFRSLRDDPR